MISLDPSRMPPRVRNISAAAVHRVWGWVSAVGAVGPQDRMGKRFASMGERSIISFPPGAVFGERWIAIGADTLIGPSVSMSVGMPGEPIDADRTPVIVIGARCNIGRGSTITARCGVVIGDDVTSGPNVFITDHNHSYADPDVPIREQWPVERAVHIGSGTWLGAGVTVLPGATIGRNVTVAAGSVVRGDVPDHAVVAGSPARVVRRWTACAGWEPPLPAHAVPSPPAGW